MEDLTPFFRTLDALITRDRRYHREAYTFVLAVLHDIVHRLERPRHISGQELLEGLRRYALDQYGPMARAVLNMWGIHTTEDIGEIVFSLVDARLLGKSATDSKDDFKTLYSFEEAFDRGVRYTLSAEPDPPAPAT